MIKSFTRIASLVLAFGFFFGCSTFSSSTNDADKEDNLSPREQQERIEEIDQELQSETGNTNLLIEQITLLSDLAKTEDDPEDRTPTYQKLRAGADALDSADIDREQAEEVAQLLGVSWSTEHNRGVELMQSEDDAASSDYESAAAHFENAIVILPDSLVSYQMKARAHYQNDELEPAIGTLEEALEQVSIPPSELLERLAFLYLEDNRTGDAVDVYEEAETFSGDNQNLLHGLANAYITSGNHQEAIVLLNQLVDAEPENSAYRETLGIELFQLSSQKIDSLISMYEEEEQPSSEQKEEPLDLTEQAEYHMNEAISLNDTPDINETVANFYQNSAFRYQQLRAHLEEDEKDAIDDQIESYLEEAISIYEELTSEKPSDTNLWRNLYQAYSYLGMDEEADQARAKANL